MTAATDDLARAAGAAAKAGRWSEAEALWRQVASLNPSYAPARVSLAIHASQRRDFKEALMHIEAAVDAAPNDPFALLTLARIQRERNDDPAERAAIDRALAIDPYFLPALLAKAAHLERLGALPTAAHYYRIALKLAPAEPQWPDVLAPQLRRGRIVAEAEGVRLNDKLEARLDPILAKLAPSLQERWREAASIRSGRSAPFHQLANQLYVPRLPAIPFYDRALFAWAPALEAKTELIRQELLAALARDPGSFSPYVTIPAGQPVDQWADLNHSTRWSSYALWRNGAPDEPRLAQCPVTRAALEAVEMATIGGLCPNAMFSALGPHAHIPPHHGETNARLVVHLPLIVPEGCAYRVGFERRTWKVGETLIFDDTIEHEARNDSDELRVVLIFDVWNPLLSQDERLAVQALAAEAREFEASGLPKLTEGTVGD